MRRPAAAGEGSRGATSSTDPAEEVELEHDP